MTHYRDLVRQNEWLRQNIFDSLGNYLYCCACRHSALGVSKDRLTWQRNTKCQQSQQPVVKMTKCEVKEKHLGQYVIMPTTIHVSLMKWWRSLVSSTVTMLRFSHKQHGNAGKVSNSAKMETRKEFLDFVDLNTQPNGCSADFSGIRFFWDHNVLYFQVYNNSSTKTHYLFMRSVCQISGW